MHSWEELGKAFAKEPLVVVPEEEKYPPTHPPFCCVEDSSLIFHGCSSSASSCCCWWWWCRMEKLRTLVESGCLAVGYAVHDSNELAVYWAPGGLYPPDKSWGTSGQPASGQGVQRALLALLQTEADLRRLQKSHHHHHQNKSRGSSPAMAAITRRALMREVASIKEAAQRVRCLTPHTEHSPHCLTHLILFSS